jgi:hypothetical protein
MSGIRAAAHVSFGGFHDHIGWSVPAQSGDGDPTDRCVFSSRSLGGKVMTEARRPYTSSSIEDLEGIFETQRDDLSVLSLLVRELSLRTTKRARRLLALAAARLAELEPEANQSEDPNDWDDELAPDEEHCDEPEYENTARPNEIRDLPDFSKQAADDAVDRDQPPDDRKRPECLSSVRLCVPRTPSLLIT